MKTFVTLAGFVSALAIGTAPVLAAPMDISDIPKIQNAGNLIVAPDGATIAYTVSKLPDLQAGDDDGTAKSQLFVKKPNADPIMFTTDKDSVGGLTFSPDGGTLYFLTRRDDDKTNGLYGISLSGGEAKKVFQHDTNIGDYAIAPDGGSVYFVAQKKKTDTSKLTEKGFDAYAYEEDLDMNAAWSASLDADAGKASLLYDAQHVTSLELSPNGQSLVVAAVPTALVDDGLMKTRLHVLNAASGDLMARVDTPGKLGGYVISPDNQRIAFQAGTDIHDTSTGVLMVANLSDGRFEQLTAEAPQHIVDLEWLDDDSILTVAHRGVESAVVAYDLGGKEERPYSTPDDIVVRDLEVGQQDNIFFIADAPAHPREVFALKPGGVDKLTSINSWLDDITLFPQTTFSYAARDGRNIEGLLITPTGTAPDGGCPLILSVHGGPEAHYSDGWLTGYSLAGQFGAGDGYAVFYPNYRGSTGRGVAFAKEHQNDYAGKEFNDLVDGVDALAEAGIIDADRAGITGGSYGGYASMWGATAQSEHFAASVAFVGISNQVSKFGTSDIPNEMHLVHSLKWPWEDNWMNLLERSPVFHAGKSTTPTLILHGERDTRVHPSQSMELYRSMKVRTDTPVRLVMYPNEGHGNRKAASQMDYAYRLMRWMDTYLAPDATRDDPMPEFDLKLGWDDDKDKMTSED
jgi:dipeptidyl aminopeptidase/acylaminoacyl peptidase